jgi:TM2 domain-containing membrane protein YozV
MKKKWLTIILSIICPGFGHFYLGEINKGLILLVCTFILNFIGFLGFLLTIYSVYDSIKLVKIVNEDFY